MPKPTRDNILAGRVDVDAYRAAHTQLHSGGHYKGISKDHTPLLQELLGKLKMKNFTCLDEFEEADEELVTIEGV